MVRIWNPNTGDHISGYIGHTEYVVTVAFSPTEKILASGSSDGTVLLWDVSKILTEE